MWKWNSSSVFTMGSIVLVLCLLGIYGIISFHAGNITDVMKENINLICELDSPKTDASTQEIMNVLRNHKSIKTETVRLVTAEDALLTMQNEMNDELLIDPEDNPFNEMILFNVKYEFVETASLDALSSELESIPGISKINYYSNVYEYIGTNVRRLSRILLILGIILAFFAFGLIYSTVQLSLYGERFKIRTMELVGASWTQIQKPFFIKSIRLALIATCISILMLILILLFLSFQFQHFNDVINYFYVFIVFVLMGLFAFGITQWASFTVVRRYLGAEKSKFF